MDKQIMSNKKQQFIDEIEILKIKDMSESQLLAADNKACEEIIERCNGDLDKIEEEVIDNKLLNAIEDEAISRGYM